MIASLHFEFEDVCRIKDIVKIDMNIGFGKADGMGYLFGWWAKAQNMINNIIG